MNDQVKYALLIVFLLLLTVLLTACQCPRGATGLTGATIPVYSAPASLLQCPTGGTVVTVGSSISVICNGGQGPAGVPGQDGGVGPTGPQGSPGIDTTPISIVQFCPGVTVYPSAFLEIGLIIDGKLYAVYSANNGFLTQIPPGNYSSNAIGSACNFTVNLDLTISH